MIVRKQTSIKVDPQAWESAKEIFKEYNLTLSDAINIFLNKVRLEGGMPFDIKIPPKNKNTDEIIKLQENAMQSTWDNPEDEVWDAL